MNGTPSKRPTMNFIFEMMKYFDTLINKEPIKPIVERVEIDLNAILSTNENKQNNPYGSV
jgi:hypothetical protein